MRSSKVPYMIGMRRQDGDAAEYDPQSAKLS
jgi:hypothetical protein